MIKSVILENLVDSLANASQGHQKTNVDGYLIEQIECGCQNSMKRLYHKYYKSLTSLINSCLTHNQDKAKVLHNSFLDIWSGHKVWDRRQTVKLFLISIVKKKINAINQVLKKTLSPDEAMKFDDSNLAQKWSDLQGQISYLSPAQRGLLFLLHKENLSYEQIATIENCSVDKIKKQFLDVLRRLKTQVT